MKEDLPHIWIIDLDVDDRIVGYYISLLSEDEKDRASRFRFEKDFKTFTITRACLRILLSGYLNIPPEKIVFHYSSFGKPSLYYPHTEIYFNVSHAHKMALTGMSLNSPIGVDIEWVKFDKDLLSVAQKFFSDAEIKEFNGLSDAEKPYGFFNCWTRKESFIKAIGSGLSFPLKEFDVSLKPGEPAVLKQTYFEVPERNSWTMKDIPLPEGYVGAYAIRQKDSLCQVSNFKHRYL